MRIAFFALFACGTLCSVAQNLVLNPSFESTSACPNDISQIDLVEGWTNLFISPDYFNACADDTASVPFNALGYQMPSDGDGYAGIGIYPLGGQEYLQGELTEALEPGVLTHVSMRVSPGGFGYATWTSPRLAASHVGLRFSVEPLDFLTSYDALHSNSAVLYMADVLSDTANWTALSAAFMPDSAYRFLQIGAFFADSLVSATLLDASGDWEVAYAFVDMVCVSKVAGVCDPAMQVAGQPEPWQGSGALVMGGELHIPLEAWGLGGAVDQVMLFDGSARLVEEKRIERHAGVVTLFVERLAAGPYVIKLVLRDRPSIVIRSWKL